MLLCVPMLLPVYVLTQSEMADMRFPVASEDKPGVMNYPGFMQHAFGQFFYVCTKIGNLAPEKTFLPAFRQ